MIISATQAFTHVSTQRKSYITCNKSLTAYQHLQQQKATYRPRHSSSVLHQTILFTKVKIPNVVSTLDCFDDPIFLAQLSRDYPLLTFL